MKVLMYGLSVALVGIGTVFVALVILIVLIRLMEKVIDLATKKPEPKQQPIVQQKTPVPAPVEVAPAVESEPEDDLQLVAVISAAVAAVLAAENDGKAAPGFAIRSIRRRSGSQAWGRAGREEQIYSRY